MLNATCKRALGSDREDRDHHVDAVGEQRRDAPGRSDGDELDRHAERLADEVGDLDVEAGRLHALVDHAIGRGGGVDGDDHLAAADDLVGGDRLGRGEAERRHGEQCEKQAGNGAARGQSGHCEFLPQLPDAGLGYRSRSCAFPAAACTSSWAVRRGARSCLHRARAPNR